MFFAFRIRLDHMADIAGGTARPDRGDAAHHRFIGDIDQPQGFQFDVAHQKHARRVAVPAVQDHGNVDVHNITVPQRLVVGNTMTHDMIDGGADSVAIAAIAQAGGDRAMGDRVIVGDLVQFGGGDAGLDQRHQHVQHLGSQAAGLAHAFKIRRHCAG